MGLLSRLFHSKKPAETIKQLTLPTAGYDDPHDEQPEHNNHYLLPQQSPPSWQETYWGLIHVQQGKESNNLPVGAKQSIIDWWDSVIPREDEHGK